MSARQIIEVACQQCGVPMQIIPIGATATGICENCCRDRDPVKDCVQAQWVRLIANFRAYLDTDVTKLPCPNQTAKALLWSHGSIGLNLWGHTKRGKTRTLLLVLRGLMVSGKTFRLFGPADFSQALDKHGKRFREYLNMLRCCDALAFDDIGRQKLSPRDEGEWYGLIEYFCAIGRPILVTHNFNGASLSKAYRHGDAIVARLREHCQSIHFQE